MTCEDFKKTIADSSVSGGLHTTTRATRYALVSHTNQCPECWQWVLEGARAVAEASNPVDLMERAVRIEEIIARDRADPECPAEFGGRGEVGREGEIQSGRTRE